MSKVVGLAMGIRVNQSRFALYEPASGKAWARVALISIGAWCGIGLKVVAQPPTPTEIQSSHQSALADSWRTLSEATTRGFHRGHAPSDLVHLAAAIKLIAIENEGDGDERRAAKQAIELLGRDSIAKARRLLSEKLDQPEEIQRFLFDALINQDQVEESVFVLLQAKAARATAYAIAKEKKLSKQRSLHRVWREHVLPYVEASAGEQTGRPSIKVTAGLLRRDVWLAARNVSGRILTNCTLNFRIREGKQGPADLTCFVSEWRTGEVIYPNYFTGWVDSPPGKEAELSKLLSVRYQLWCDQLSAPPKSADIIDGYRIRDPFCGELFGRSARYIELSRTERATLEFHGVRRRRGSATVEATLEVVDLSTKRKNKMRYRGEWVEDKNQTFYFHPAAPWFRMTPKRRSSRRQRIRGPVRDLITLRWQEGRLTLTPTSGRVRKFIAMPMKPKRHRARTSSPSRSTSVGAETPSWLPIGKRGKGKLVIGEVAENLSWRVALNRKGEVRFHVTLKDREALIRYSVGENIEEAATRIQLVDPAVVMKSKKPVPDLGKTLNLRVTRASGKLKLEADLNVGGEKVVFTLERELR